MAVAMMLFGMGLAVTEARAFVRFVVFDQCQVFPLLAFEDADGAYVLRAGATCKQ